MAGANHKARLKAEERETLIRMVLERSCGRPAPDDLPRMPWMEVVDAHLALFGMKPGDEVCFVINHVTRQIRITPTSKAPEAEPPA